MPDKAEAEESKVEKPGQSPLQIIKEQEAARHSNKEVNEERPTMRQPPSLKRTHPERRLG